MDVSVKRILLAAAFLVAATTVLSAVAGLFLGLPSMVTVVKLLLAGIVLLLLIWLTWRVVRIFLWRVGRKLTFSYFLIGMLPIPMVALLVGLTAYLLAGFFLGHLYRDALGSLQQDLDRAATWTLVSAFCGMAKSDNGVERIFLGYGTQKLLYKWAKKKGVSKKTLSRMFQYPHGRETPTGIIRHEPAHDDHLHVRFKCPAGDKDCD